MEKSTHISLQCLFCFSEKFVLPEENYTPQSGELIQCSNCERMNDYDSLIRVFQKKGNEFAEAQAKELIDDFSKQVGKIFK